MAVQEALVLPGPMTPAGFPRRQRWTHRGVIKVPPVEVREGHLGMGLYAMRRLAKGELILRGWGDPLPHRTQHSIQVNADQHILPHTPLHLLNHSCAPNCGLLVRRGVEELQVHALRAIAAGEELTIDYETFEEEIHFMPGLCLCNSPSCRGRITGYRNLPRTLREAYGRYVAEYLRERRS